MTHYPTLVDLMEVHPPIVPPETSVLNGLMAMYHREQTSDLNSVIYGPHCQGACQSASYVLIYPIHNPDLPSGAELGIFTERDLVRLTASGQDLAQLKLGEAMTRPVITIREADPYDLFSILFLFRQYQIRHLPVLSATGDPLGVVTLDKLREQLQPINLLKFRSVTEVMTQPEFEVHADTSILQISQLMLTHKLSCVVVTQQLQTWRSPIGIITERDIIQVQLLGLDLAQTPALTVMSQPVFSLYTSDHLLKAYQEMQCHRVRHLAIIGPQGDFQGILTQTNLLSVLNSLEIYEFATLLQAQVTQLEAEKINLLTAQNQLLQNQAASCNQALQNQVISLNLLLTLQQRIRQSLNFQDILKTTVTEVQKILGCNQVMITRFQSQGSGMIVAESNPHYSPCFLGHIIPQSCFPSPKIEQYLQGKLEIIDSLSHSNFSSEQIQRLQRLKIGSMVVVPIVQLNLPSRTTPYLWGLLIASQEQESHPWLASEVELLEKLATPLSIAIQQSELYQQSQAELRERKRAESEIRKLNRQLESTNLILRAEVEQHRITEAALEQERNFVSGVLSVAGALVIVLDREGRVVRFNQACEQLTGYQFSEMVGKTIWDCLLLPEDKTGVKRTFQQLKAGHFPNQHENYWVSRAGILYLIAWSNTVITNPQGEVEYIIATGIDITERKQAELALQASEEKFRQLAENIREVFFIYDAQTYHIIYTSPAFEQIWGYSCETVYQDQQAWLTSIHPDDREGVTRILRSAATGENFSTEYRIINPRGEIRWIRARGFPVCNPGGQVYRIVGVAEDITERKQAAAALQASERRYATLAATAPVGIFRTNLQGHCLYANEEAHKIIGIPDQGSFEVCWLHHLHPEDRDRVCANLAQTITQRTAFRAEYRFQHPDGQVIWVLEQYEPEKNDRGEVTGYVGTLTDITRRKQAETSLQQLNEQLEAKVQERTAQLVALTQTLQTEINERQQAEIALRESEERFRIIFEQVAVGIILLNPAGEFLKFNRKFCQILGYSATELKDSTIFQLTHPDDLPHCQADLSQLWSGDLKTYTVEKRYLRSDHTIVWAHITISRVCQASGTPDYLIAVVEDISERKQSEVIQAALMRRNESIIQALGEIVYDHLVPTDTIIWDGNYTKVLGYTPQEMGNNAQQSWLNRIHPDDLALALEEFQRAYREDRLYDIEYRLQLKDGSYRWFQDRGVMHGSLGNQPEQVIGVLRDVTQRKQVEEELRQALAKEKELNELKSRFISMTSHEFRTPLTTILGSAELLKHCSDHWSLNKKEIYWNRIQENVQHMTQMLDDILTLGKGEAGCWKFNPAPLNLEIFCQDLVAEFQSGLGQFHHLIFTHEGLHLVPNLVNFDATLLRKMLSNLFSNAIKYSPPKSEIRFHLKITPTQVIWQIQDAGIGIPTSEQVHLFESFYRAQNVGNIQGTGLGLAIVKKAVDLHGGVIQVDSQEGAGTRFTITLDLTSAIY